MSEWAVLQGGEIVNVVMTDSPQSAERVAARMEGELTVKLLDELPLAVLERYRYWNERP